MFLWRVCMLSKYKIGLVIDQSDLVVNYFNPCSVLYSLFTGYFNRHIFLLKLSCHVGGTVVSVELKFSWL